MTRHGLVVGLWLACLAAAGLWIALSIRVDHRLSAFLPDRGRPIETLLWSRIEQGPTARLVLMAFEGGTPERRIEASRAAVSALRALPGVARVANGEGAPDLDAFDPLFAYRYLLVDPGDFDADRLGAALRDRLRELRSPIGAMVERNLAADPTAQFRRLLGDWSGQAASPAHAGGVWVSPDKARTLLLVEAGPSDPEREAQLVGIIRAAAQDIAASHEVGLLLAGRPVLAAQARDDIRASTIIGGIAASALVIGLLLWIYRSVAVLILGVVPLISGVVAGLAAVLLAFGAVHAIALAFGVTLLGIAIDYPLHLFSHARAGEALARTASRIQKPLGLSAATTAVAFVMFGLGQVPGLGQLALFTSVGVLIAAATVRFVVPSLAVLIGSAARPRRYGFLPLHAPKGAAFAAAAAALVGFVVLLGGEDALFEEDLNAFSPVPAAARRLDGELRAQLGAPDLRHLLLIGGADAEAVLSASEQLAPLLGRLRQEGAIEGFDAPHRYLPSVARQEGRQAMLPGSDQLAVALAAATADLPYQAGLFDPFEQAIDASRSMAPLSGEAGLKLFGETPLGARVGNLLVPFEGRWYGFVPLQGVRRLEPLERLAADRPDLDLIDLKRLSEEVLAEVRNEAFTLLGIGVAAVAALMLAGYAAGVVVRIVLVLGAAMVVTAAILHLLGQGITMLHILAGILVIGMGLDYCVFFTWRSASDAPDSDGTDADVEREQTLHALITCLLSTALVFGLLALSTIEVLRAIGLTVVIGVCSTFAIGYAVLSRSEARGPDRSRPCAPSH